VPPVSTALSGAEKRAWAEAQLEDEEPGALFFDGLDSAIVGIGNQYTKSSLVVYDAELIVEAFVAQGMTYEEAREYAEFNVFDAWVGEGTPIVIMPPDAG
jgi:hypothetical protein